MGERKSKFTYCVRAIGLGAFLGLWAAGEAGAQTLNSSPSPAFSPTATFTSNTTGTPTSTTTFTSTVTETSTPTWTYTQDPFAAWNIYTTPTYSPTPTETPWGYIAPPTATPTETPWGYEGSPSSTPTFMNTPTPTITGTQYPTDTFTPTWTNTPSISRGALALMPTAFSNGWDHWDGLNWDIVFAYYIGSIAEKDIHADSTSYLNPLRIWLLTNDLKYGWLEAGGDQPGLASGFLFTLLLSGGNPGETGSASQNFQLTNSNLGGFYTVMSVPVDTNNAIHFGFVEGLHDALKGIGIPTMNYGDLLPQLSGNLFSDLGGTSSTPIAPAPSNLFYTGWNTRMLGTNWKFEIWKPFPMPSNPVLFNSQVDGLFAFNLSYMRWDQGYSLLGYFNFRFTIVPEAPAY